MEEKMTFYWSGWVHVIIGSLAIALGGYLTTKGWNQFNCHSEKGSLITAAQREWRQNDTYLGLMSVHHSKLDDIDNPILMSTLHYDELQRVLTSYLFEKKNEKDKRLLNAIADYLQNLKPVNDSITKLNYIVSGHINSDHRKITLSEFYRSALLKRFREHHLQLGEELNVIDNKASSDLKTNKSNSADAKNSVAD